MDQKKDVKVDIKVTPPGKDQTTFLLQKPYTPADIPKEKKHYTDAHSAAEESTAFLSVPTKEGVIKLDASVNPNREFPGD